MKNNKYQCCFCNETITSNNIDVTSLIVVFNWDKSEQLQQEQQLFCHVNCLKELLSNDVKLYFANTEE